MYCRQCGYFLEHIESTACPECGRGFDADNPASYDLYSTEHLERRYIKRGLILLGIFAISFIILSIYIYNEERLTVIWHGWHLRNAQITHIDGFVDGGPPPLAYLNVTGVEIKVAGKGTLGFQLASTDTDVFTDGRNIVLYQVGPHRIYEMSGTLRSSPMLNRRQRGALSHHRFDVGRDGEFATLLPFEVCNVQDAIDHYDELVALVDELLASQ